MPTRQSKKPQGASQILCGWLESATMAIVCVCCITGVFMCGGVLLASLNDPVPVIVLACLFTAGTMVSASEVMNPRRRK